MHHNLTQIQDIWQLYSPVGGAFSDSGGLGEALLRCFDIALAQLSDPIEIEYVAKGESNL